MGQIKKNGEIYRETGDIHREKVQIEGQIKNRERQRKGIDQGIDSKKGEIEKKYRSRDRQQKGRDIEKDFQSHSKCL